MNRRRPLLSAVIPTFQRRDVVLASIQGFEQQETTHHFEVIVVVDGSEDGTAEALRVRPWSFPLHVVEQANAGAAAARNAGAAHAGGRLLLFLDDDMEPAPSVVDVHVAAHEDGAEAVVGAMPLHPDSPATLLSAGVGRWAEKMAIRCSARDHVMTADDVFTGHLSVRRELFERLGGFNTRFTAGGTFGNEDVDLAQRLIDAAARVVFRPDAVARQRFVITALQHIRRAEDLGIADMVLLRTHPDLDDERRVAALRSRPSDPVGRLVLAAPRLTSLLLRPMERLVALWVDRGTTSAVARKLLKGLHDARYWRGVWNGGGPLDGSRARVLCWHALQDLAGDPILAPYGVPPHVLAQQLATLSAAGWTALSPDELRRLVRSAAPVPRRSFFVTFDDCYAELVTEGRSVLRAADVPAAAFVVTHRVGDCNRWDAGLGVRSLPLATWEQLADLSDDHIELGAHSRTHRKLSRLDDAELEWEIAGAAADLEARGSSPRMFAYPHGDTDARVRAATRAAGFEIGLTVTPGTVSGALDPFDLPRVEVFPDDVGRRLLRKVRLAGRLPLLWVLWRRRPAVLAAFVRRGARAVRRRAGGVLPRS